MCVGGGRRSRKVQGFGEQRSHTPENRTPKTVFVQVEMLELSGVAGQTWVRGQVRRVTRKTLEIALSPSFWCSFWGVEMVEENLRFP